MNVLECIPKIWKKHAYEIPLLLHLSIMSRKKKFNLFMKIMRPCPTDRVLNIGAGNVPKLVGGGIMCFFENNYLYRANIVSVDISHQTLQVLKKKYREITTITADACSLPFRDKSFDIVFSNAVMEHLESWHQQEMFAKEVMRVGKRWFVVVPNKHFPIEQHYYIPFFQFLPKKMQQLVIERIISRTWHQINHLSTRDLHKLFPGSKVKGIRVTVYPESLVAYF